MEISASAIKNLREKTGVGIMDCKKALQESEGDIEKAIDYLRKKGIATAKKKGGEKYLGRSGPVLYPCRR